MSKTGSPTVVTRQHAHLQYALPPSDIGSILWSHHGREHYRHLRLGWRQSQRRPHQSGFDPSTFPESSPTPMRFPFVRQASSINLAALPQRASSNIAS